MSIPRRRPIPRRKPPGGSLGIRGGSSPGTAPPMTDRPRPDPTARRSEREAAPAPDAPRPLAAAGFDRALRVHDLAQLRAALTAAAGRPVLVVSGRGAGAYAGAGWWRALLAAAEGGGGAMALGAIAVLDCGEMPGPVLAAVRAGVADILCRREAADAEHAAPSVAGRLAAMAAAGGSRLWRPPLPQVLDLGGVRHPAAAARRWIEGPPPAASPGAGANRG